MQRCIDQARAAEIQDLAPMSQMPRPNHVDFPLTTEIWSCAHISYVYIYTHIIYVHISLSNMYILDQNVLWALIGSDYDSTIRDASKYRHVSHG